MTCVKQERRMPRKWSAIMLMLFACVYPGVAVYAEARSKSCFNFDWKFKPGASSSVDWETVDESQWQAVQLPHDASVSGSFNREQSNGANGWLPHGQGSYLKRFHIDESVKGKKVFVQFEGVYRDAKVFINGTELGRHLNGYLGFEHELSSYLNYGGDNTMVVTYDNTTKDTSRWYTGEGIYRDVWLIVTDPIYVPQYGTYVTTPVAREDEAVVKIETNVINDKDQRKMVRLVTELYDPKGKKVAESVAVAPVSTGESYKFVQEINVRTPHLWSCDEPHLYRAVSKVYTENHQVDDYVTTFGIRDIKMTPEKGLLVNGKKVIAKGGNMHHDLGPLGSAALEKGYERKLTCLKAMGCNSIRLSHNPHAPVLLDLADRLGILVFDEVYDKWTSQFYGGVESFEANWQKDLTTFIKRDRNHACVYIWSMGNEVLKQNRGYDHKFETAEAGADYGVGVYRRMAALTRALDPSRKVTMALFPAREQFIVEWSHWDDYDTFTRSNPAEMAFYGDVVSWNYTENMFASDHERFPQLMFIASETSTNLKFGTRKLSWLELDLDRIIGHYYWTATDYLGESVWPTKVWGRAFLDITDEMTPIGSLYQSVYDNTPMVHMWGYETKGQLFDHFTKMDNKRWNWYPMSDHWNWETKTVTVQTITNAEEVELTLNGRSLGVKQYAKGSELYQDWEVPFEAGQIKAVARNQGKVVAEHVLTTATKPVAIQLNSDVQTLKANGLDLAYIKVSLVDKAGVVVPNADRLIHFDVQGNGILAGVANSNVFSDEPWVASQKTTHKGTCMLVIRSTRKQGTVTIKASADGLPTQTLQLTCLEVESGSK